MFHDKQYPLKALQKCAKIAQGLQYNEEVYYSFRRSPTTDVPLGSIYSSAYIYIQVSPIETMCILNIFAVEYLFLTKEE